MYRLVIVDDEYIVVKGIQVVLSRIGADCDVVGTAADGKTALEVIHNTKPDVVITDIRIPYIDGLSLIEECREFLDHADYIIISGYQEFEYARRALILGALDYIDKPVTAGKLRTAFERVEKRRKKPSEVLEMQPVSAGDDENFADAAASAENHHAIGASLSYIQNNYTRDIGLTELGELVGMNPAYLSVLFKENVGISFVKYLTGLRMEKAKELLARGEKASDVAAAVGYNDAHYFYETFKKKNGMTPSEYKESRKSAL